MLTNPFLVIYIHCIYKHRFFDDNDDNSVIHEFIVIIIVSRFGNDNFCFRWGKAVERQQKNY